MAELFPVPEIAAGTTEIVVSDWLVEPGAGFKAGDPIAIIETEKAVVEVEAEADATLLRALIEAGKAAEVGAPMALIGSAEEAGGDLDALLADLGVSGPAGGREATPRRDVAEPRAGSAGTRPDQALQEQPATSPATQPGASGATQTPAASGATETPASPGAAGRLFISPIARKLLKEAGVSPDGIEGSGPNGRIRRRDVEPIIAAAASGASGVPTPQEAEPTAAPTSAPITVPGGHAAPSGSAGGTEVPHSRLRRAVARRLTESKQQVPHFYVRRTVVLDELLKLRSQINEASPTRISVNDFLIRAMAVAHTEVPDANVIWTDEAMRQFDSVDISVAIASERGLVTPVLRGVEWMSLSAISAQVKDFVVRANEGRLQQSDLEGGSISISNLGMYGADDFSAIINPPQSAILAVGAGRPTPVAVGGKVKVRTAAELVLSVDHRAIDGALAARWMTALVDAIHQPLRLLV
jgi:pyruvate dehydrogenase E2 component (dihydrolipoamide acetyltransferase)